MPEPYLATSLSEKQLAEMHRLMTEEVRDVAVFFMDPEGVITSWNRGAEDMKGYTAEEAIGQHLRLLYTDDEKARRWPEHNIRKAREDGFYREETWRKRKDGSVFWARIALTALIDRERKLIGYSKITVDLTEHKMLERCVAEREETRRVLKAANAGMWHWHPREDRMRVCANFLHLLGHPEVDETMSFDSWISFVAPEDHANFVERFERALREAPRTPFAADIRMCHKDGERRWFHVHADWHLESQRAQHVLSGVIVDIDELKTTGEQLRAAIEKLKQEDARKDEFLAMLAHELRNPLAPIRAGAELLRMGRHDEARVKKTSEVIARQVDHMTSLINDLLDVSRVTRGLVRLERGRVDFGHVLNDAIEQINPMIRARRHRLALDLSPDVAIVDGDEKRLVQMVSNLLHNAAKFTPEGGRITLTTDVQAQQIVVRVADNGVGMPAELVEQVFELFVQAKRTPDRATGGLGLGLALVKSLAELHGGHVDCESPGPDQGTTFTVCLPLAAGVGSSLARPEASDATPTRADVVEPTDERRGDGARALRLLLVDDNIDAAQMLGSYLEELGYRVAIEYSAVQALERARAERPDVCLLDIGLPEMDGAELARRIREQPETSSAVFVAITGYGKESDGQMAESAVFSHRFVKPVDASELVALLKTL
ncbi:hybrid sensor histidine kinase/response regulator [Variovorax sp. LT1P1]|uniref:PAS domain-containing hybrid sensor histidine kinase/response regulator n=1 Tax=Variovorax sp. LT1P1 TaxID=3443730 RepID=UPI003F479757